MRLDELQPRWHFRERHALSTTAPAQHLVSAAEQVTWAEVPVLRRLMRLRSAGRLPVSADHRILDDMSTIGFIVLDRTPDELVVGSLGRPWSPTGGHPPRLVDQADPARFFVDFADPGWAKMIVNFRASPGELTTETRVLLTDDRARRAFGRYWLVIRPFSGLIRVRWLAGIARRARQS